MATRQRTTLRVGVVGPGLVGAELLRQLAAFGGAAAARRHVDLRIVALATSKRMLLLDDGDVLSDLLQVAPLLDRLQAHGGPADLAAVVRHVKPAPTSAALLIDCSASHEIAALYPAWMRAGVHVVTPNKKAFSGDRALYDEIARLRQDAGVSCYHEATVGAGLPILNTLADLVDTGDRIERIEGILSGTLSYLFNTFCAAGSTRPFSAIVNEAKALGYTEPDPRDDLSGTDFARKVVILGRCSGIPLDLSTLPVESIVPEPLRAVPSADAFLSRLPEFDAHFDQLRAEAARAGEVLRYVGVVDARGGSGVQLRRYPTAHPFAALHGGANVVAFTTARYPAPSPLVIQGAGAGAAVTAMGVFADVLRVMQSL